MKLYVALLNDRHIDTDVEVFTNQSDAVQCAKDFVRENSRSGEYEEEVIPGWLYYASYGEGNSVWVIEKELHE